MDSEPDTSQAACGLQIKAEPVDDSPKEDGFPQFPTADDRRKEVDFRCDFTYEPGSSVDLSSSPVSPEPPFVTEKKRTPDFLRIALRQSANPSDAQQPQCESYRCQRCFATFELFSFFKQHMASVHGENIQDVLAMLSTPESFQVGHYGNVHVPKKVGETRNLEKTDSKQIDMIDRTLVEKDGKQHVCEVCSKAFARVDSLKRHKMIHIGLKQFECDECGKAFTQAGHLREHKLTHTGQKQFVCNVCNKAFSRSDNLKTHMLIHTGEKQFVCYVCFKAFTLSHHLEQHKLIHSGIRQHVCDVCNRAFIESGHLKRHKLIHVSQKDFVCEVCNKAFAAASKLKQHKTIHTRHK